MINGIGDQAFVSAFLSEDDIEEAQETYDDLQKAEKGTKKYKRLKKRLETLQKKQLAAVQELIDADETGALEAWFNKIINLDPDSPQYLSMMSDEQALRELQTGVGKEFYDQYNKYGRAWFMVKYGPDANEEDVKAYTEQAERDIRTELAALGIDPDTVDTTGWVDKYYQAGYQNSENRGLFREALVNQYGAGPGERVDYGQELRDVALANGVRRDDSWFTKAEERLASGEMNLNIYEDEFRKEAASRYPLFSQRLMAGEDLWDISSPWRQAIEDILEYKPQDIFDQNLAYAMEGQMGEDGTPSAMSLWEYKKYLRNQPEWEKTVNGRRTIDNSLAELATMFGIGF